ncbi:hypothetical protein [Spirillospora sp. NPDC047279]|uniref:hypothetical protein n=1 Tax=Spirillospora sp. NPDC047279 TaxID=3155478 RepID=UPI00340AC9A9
MPTFDRARRPGDSGTPDLPASRTGQAWPVVIALATAVVFVVFLVHAGLSLAVVMALATVVAATILVTLVTGTAWLTRLRDLAPHPRGHH